MKDSYVMIPQVEIADLVSLDRKYATLPFQICHKVVINGVVVKDELVDGLEYRRIYSNEGGFFGPGQVKGRKVLIVAAESYIERPSFVNGDSGGHMKNLEYPTADDLFNEHFYQVLVKIALAVDELFESGCLLDLDAVDFTDDVIKDKASLAMRKYFAVTSILPFPGISGDGKSLNTKDLKRWLEIPQVRDRFLKYVAELDVDLVYVCGWDPGEIFEPSDKEMFSLFNGPRTPETVSFLGHEVTDYLYESDCQCAKTDFVNLIYGIHPSKPGFSHEEMGEVARLIHAMLL